MSTDAAPPDLDQQLGQIQAISQNARTTWFGLIALNLFVGVTLMAHRDADFFARDAATKLPILNIDVPVVSFFIAAPLLVTAIHTYLQVYLVSLWKALGQLPPTTNGTPVSEKVFPWLMAQSALQLRAQLRKSEAGEPAADGRRPLRRLVVWSSGILGWLLPILILVGLWLRSAPLHNPWLTGWIAVLLLGSAYVAWAGYAAMRGFMTDKQGPKNSGNWRIWGAAGLLVVTLTTIETTFVTNWLRWPDPTERTRERFPDWLPSHHDIVAVLPGRAASRKNG